jgi:4-hydroxy-3-methylbut-2-enyl diphosphate reductase
MLQTRANLAIVVGGYNSSNTSHLVELCEEVLPTYFVNSAEKILSEKTIMHFDFHKGQEMVSENYLPEDRPVSILITSGASCPDAVVEEIIRKLSGFFPGVDPLQEIIPQFQY